MLNINAMKHRKIFVAGNTGMVGSAICRQLSTDPNVELITRGRDELDLLDQNAVQNFMRTTKPDEVILAAAMVGGIQSQISFPADFIYKNVLIQNNVIHASHLINVNKLLFISSSCIYPVCAPQPIHEDSVLTGILDPTHEPYALAKIVGMKMCDSYNRQYGRHYRCVVPSNLYGPGDNYRIENNHVVPALIRRFHEAKLHNSSEVVVWGTGAPMREFMYVDDMAEASLFVHNLPDTIYEENMGSMLSHINIGTGVDVTIKELAQTVKAVVGFKGELIFDKSKPDGTMRKLMDVSTLRALGYVASTSLRSGLELAYADFFQNSSALRM